MNSLLEQLNLSGRVAIVTGGSRGIGRAISELLAEMRARVVVNYAHDAEPALKLVDDLKEKGRESVAIQADVSIVSQAHQLVEEALKHFGRVDVLVCSAGIWEGSPVEEMSEELWNRTIDINLKGTWAVCQAAIRVMKSQKSGRVVVISSTAGQRGEAGYSNYGASKAGQIGFVKSLADEVGRWGITVNAVAPGWVDTEMTAVALGDEARRKAIAQTIPLRSIATPSDIAGPVAFLCTDWARHITGEVLNVNGGSVLCG